MKKLLLLLFLSIFSNVGEAQPWPIRILIVNQSDKAPNAGKGFLITPLTGGGNPGSTNDAGLFDIKLSNAKPGDRLDLLVAKANYQILGPDTRIFGYAVPSDPNDIVRIAVIKTTDFNVSKFDFEAAIEKSIKQATARLGIIIDSLKKAVNEDVRNVLAKTIKEQSDQINELRKNKEELARKLAQVDLEQASEFAQLALKKFKEEGDLRAALAMIPDNKLDEFWNNVLLQEEKMKKAKEQGVENYMIRARLLIADFQFGLAYGSYLDAIKRDSNNVNNLWEVSIFLAKQRQDLLAIKLFEKFLDLAITESDRAGILNNLGNLYLDNQKVVEAEKAYIESIEINRKLVNSKPDIFLSELGMVLNNLGTLYYSSQKMTEAERAFLEALTIRRKLSNSQTNSSFQDLAATLDNLGNYYCTNQNNIKAKLMFEEALKLREQLAEIDSIYLPDLAKTFNNLGSYFSNIDKKEDAGKMHIEAFKIRKRLAAYNPDAYLIDLVSSLNNLGNYYSRVFKNQEAEQSFLEAINIINNMIPKNPEAFQSIQSTILNNLGTVYQENKKQKEAEKAYLDALTIRRKLAHENSDFFLADLTSTIYNLASLYEESGKIKEALNAYGESIGNYRKLANQNQNAYRSYLAFALNGYGDFSKSIGNFLESKNLLLEALSIYLAAILNRQYQFSANLGQAIRNYKELRDTFLGQKNYHQVIDITQTLAITWEALINIDSSYAKNATEELRNLAWYNLFIENYKTAQTATEKGLHLTPASTWIITNLATSLVFQGEYEKAQPIYEKFKDQLYNGQKKTYREVFLQDLLDLEKEGITHPDVAKVRKLLENK